MSNDWMRTKVPVTLACAMAFMMPTDNAWADGQNGLTSHTATETRCVTAIALQSLQMAAPINPGTDEPDLSGHVDPSTPDAWPRVAKTAERASQDCKQHPWVRQMRQWQQQGMPLEVAMQWIITDPDSDLYPLLTGDLGDLARMQAAYTLANNGFHADARHLWLDLSRRRPFWAEVWFNLGVSYWLSSNRPVAARHLQRAQQICLQQRCRIQSQTLTDWIERSGETP